jgi:hypothetical protein
MHCILTSFLIQMEINLRSLRQMKDLWLLGLSSQYQPEYYETAKHYILVVLRRPPHSFQDANYNGYLLRPTAVS